MVTRKASCEDDPVDWIGDGRSVRPWDRAAMVAAMTAFLLPVTSDPRPWTVAASLIAGVMFVALRHADLRRRFRVPHLRDSISTSRGEEEGQNRAFLRHLLGWLAISGAAASLVAVTAGWQRACAGALLAFWTIFKVEGARASNLATLIKNALGAQEWMAKIPTKTAGAIVTVLEFVFGYPAVHAFHGRFGKRRTSWM